MSTTNVSRAATAGLIGGALWALLPVAWASAHLEDIRPGTLAWFGVDAVYWIFPVLAPLLIVVGLTAPAPRARRRRRPLGPHRDRRRRRRDGGHGPGQRHRGRLDDRGRR